MGVGCPGKRCGALHGWCVLVSVVEHYMGVGCPGKCCGALHGGGVSW